MASRILPPIVNNVIFVIILLALVFVNEHCFGAKSRTRTTTTEASPTIAPTEPEFEIEVPIDYGVCENWTLAIEAAAGECSWRSWANGETLQCFGGLNNLQNLTQHNHKVLQTDELVICGWPNATFDPNILRHFPHIKILRIEHSNLTHIHNDFPEMRFLQNINISWTKLGYTRPTLFRELPALKHLDLRWNNLKHMHGKLQLPESFDNLLLAGNPWNCSRLIEWILNERYAEFITDRHLLLCAQKPYINRPVLTVMQYKQILAKECSGNEDLRNCSCQLYYLRPIDEGHALAPMYSINCSHRGLYTLPSYVPKNTTIFYATHNQISSLDLLRTTYKNVHDVYLDWNRIDHVEILEADNWLETFRVFSLKGNQMPKLPVYVLDNALKDNHQVAKLYLSQNPWRCECIFIIRFQELLRKYHSIIVDSSNVTCQSIDGNDGDVRRSVLALTHGDVCDVPFEHNAYLLNLLNIVLSSMIVLMLAKLAYDYYHYRKSGRLPWIVTKMP